MFWTEIGSESLEVDAISKDEEAYEEERDEKDEELLLWVMVWLKRRDKNGWKLQGSNFRVEIYLGAKKGRLHAYAFVTVEADEVVSEPHMDCNINMQFESNSQTEKQRFFFLPFLLPFRHWSPFQLVLYHTIALI